MSALFPLKYSAGYAIQIVPQNITKTMSAPYTYQFKMSSNLLINNYNLQLVLYAVSGMIMIVNYVRFIKYRRQSKQEIFKLD